MLQHNVLEHLDRCQGHVRVAEPAGLEHRAKDLRELPGEELEAVARREGASGFRSVATRRA